MARLPRLEAPGLVHWVGLRGNNGQAIFTCEQDYADALRFAKQAKVQHGVDILGYCLLPQGMHWLLRPGQEKALSLWVQQLGRHLVRSINRRHDRSGTLFEGRFRSGVLQASSHLLPCMWALDSEPVRLGLVQQATDWAYSSAAWYAGKGSLDSWASLQPPAPALNQVLTMPDEIWQLGNTPYEREAQYAQGLAQAYTPHWLADLQAGWAVGDAAFLQELQARLSRRIGRAARGRPRKKNQGA